MRQVQVVVPDERYDSIDALLEAEGIDVVRQRVWMGDEELWLLQFPVPTDAIGYVLGELEEAGLDPDRFTVIESVESASTAGMEGLRDRFAGDFDPLTPMELRSKVLDLSRDMRSYIAMILLSAVIATAGLLDGSPAVVVGSMVIAPIVGPVLTTAVGMTTGDRRMLADSVWYQAAGVAVAIAVAFTVGIVLQLGGFLPSTLDIASLDLVAVRVAPGILTAVVGLAAGAAAAYGLATKGPTALIGVMIAAALIPAAATVGIAAAWNHPRIAAGSLLLVLLTLLLINLGSTLVLWRVGYGSPVRGIGLPSRGPVAIGLVLIVAVGLAFTVGAAYDQAAQERSITEEVDAVVSGAEHDAFELVTVRSAYQGEWIDGPVSVTVHVSQTGPGDREALAADLEDRLGEDTQLRLQVTEYR